MSVFKSALKSKGKGERDELKLQKKIFFYSLELQDRKQVPHQKG